MPSAKFRPFCSGPNVLNVYIAQGGCETMSYTESHTRAQSKGGKLVTWDWLMSPTLCMLTGLDEPWAQYLWMWTRATKSLQTYTKQICAPFTGSSTLPVTMTSFNAQKYVATLSSNSRIITSHNICGLLLLISDCSWYTSAKLLCVI